MVDVTASGQSRVVLDLLASEGVLLRFKNIRRRITSLLKYVGLQRYSKMFLESSGVYERRAISRLHVSKKLTVQFAHLLRECEFACAAGYKEKNGPLSARKLPSYALALSELDTLEPEPGRERLKGVQNRNRLLVEPRV